MCDTTNMAVLWQTVHFVLLRHRATNSLSQAYCMFPSNDPSPSPDSAVGITGTVPWPLYRLLERTNCANVLMKIQEFGGRR